MSSNLYHTVGDRGNPKYIESNGPFECTRKDAWLGAGYYFWEDYINNAHWWGKGSYHGKYVICHAVSDYDKNDCIDFTDKTNLEDLKTILKTLHNRGIVDETITFPEILEILRNKGVYKQDIVKIKTEFTKKFNPDNAVKFNCDKHQFLDLEPPVQIRFKSKQSIKITKFTIVFPPKYIDGYVT